MKEIPQPLDLTRLKVLPLAARQSLTRVEDILVDPESQPAECSPEIQQAIQLAAQSVAASSRRGASVILMYGAHLLRNGAALILERMMDRGWITHLATNGAGSIHDWEYAFSGSSTESVEQNVAAGSFGAWDETGRYLHLAMMAGALRGEGYGRSLGRLIMEEGTDLPSVGSLVDQITKDPGHELTAARADLLRAMQQPGFSPGRLAVPHPWKHTSIFGQAFRHHVPLTVHPGIGYDIISNHPMFNGAVIGRAAGLDFKLFGAAVEKLDGGTVLSIGSAIMAPQVFEKSLSCVHNLRFQSGLPPVEGHKIFVVDLQDGGHWDWTRGEPPKTHSAYYLRFCKSFSRMGGEMRYTCCDNLLFIHHLYHELKRLCG